MGRAATPWRLRLALRAGAASAGSNGVVRPTCRRSAQPMPFYAFQCAGTELACEGMRRYAARLHLLLFPHSCIGFLPPYPAIASRRAHTRRASSSSWAWTPSSLLVSWCPEAHNSDLRQALPAQLRPRLGASRGRPRQWALCASFVCSLPSWPLGRFTRVVSPRGRAASFAAAACGAVGQDCLGGAQVAVSVAR